MSAQYFDKFNPINTISPLIDAKKVVDIRDEKWAYPEFKTGWCSEQLGSAGAGYNMDYPLERSRF